MDPTRVSALQGIAQNRGITDPNQLLATAGGNFTLAEARAALGINPATATSTTPITSTSTTSSSSLSPYQTQSALVGQSQQSQTQYLNNLAQSGQQASTATSMTIGGANYQKQGGIWYEFKPWGAQVVVTDPQTLAQLYGYSGTAPTTTAPQTQTTPQAQTQGIQSTGDPVLDSTLGVINQYLDRLAKNGQMINPQVSITPDQAANFLAQASTEIDPYYQTQLKLAQDTLNKQLGYSTTNLLANENQAQTQYGRSLRTLGENAADQGFALSGIRQREEQQLAQDTQYNIDQARRQLQQTSENAVSQYAQQYGGGNIPNLTIPEKPTVVPGQSQFATSGRQLPFYSLSPDVYSGLTGQQQYEQQAAKLNRQSQLESAALSQAGTSAQRQITI